MWQESGCHWSLAMGHGSSGHLLITPHTRRSHEPDSDANRRTVPPIIELHSPLVITDHHCAVMPQRRRSNDPRGNPSVGLPVGNGTAERVSIHHNLLAHNKNRNLRPAAP